MRILLPLAEGFEEIEAVTIIDVLRRGGLDVTTATLDDNLAVKGAHNIVVKADTTWPDSDNFDVIVLPGGGTGTENLGSDPRVIEALKKFEAEGKLVAAICAAPTVLEQAGILEGKRATCYPACAPQLGASYDDMPAVADGNVITSQGPATAMLFALVLVEHLAGKEVAQKLANGLLAEF